MYPQASATFCRFLEAENNKIENDHHFTCQGTTTFIFLEMIEVKEMWQ